MKEKNENWEKEYEVLKTQAMEMQNKFEIELRNTKMEKKQLRKTFLQVQQ